MVLTLMLPIRAIYGLHDFITERHVDNMAKVLLATGLIVFYGVLHGGVLRLVQRQPVRAVHDPEPDDPVRTRSSTGCSSSVTAWCRSSLWFRRVRRAILPLFAICMAVNVGMWLA